MVWLIILVLLKSLLWTAVVPIFQAPDEQAHFAQLQYMVENRTLELGYLNLSQEIAVSEGLLGTRRDAFGNNKYTYHPEYKPSGNFQAEINNQPKASRTIYVDREAAGYPPLYYLLATPFYQVVYSRGLIDRLLAVRLLSLVCYFLLVVTAYKTGKIIWSGKLLPVSLAILTAFQPMVSFVASGFHPDNLLNLIYSVFLLVCLLILKNGLKRKYILALAALTIAGLATKPLMYYSLPLAAAVIVYKKFPIRYWLPLVILLLLGPVIYFVGRISVPFLPQIGGSGGVGFIEYLRFRVPKMVFEVWPWYWGVFRWLSLTLPPLVLKIVTRLAALAIIGLAVKMFLIIKKRKFGFEEKALFFLLISCASYIVYLLVLDWRFMQSTGFSLGIQGRYLLPNITAQMALLLVGWITLFGRFKKVGAVILSLAMIVLNVVALITVAQSY